MQEAATVTAGMRDLSLRAAARLIGVSAVTLRSHWHEIPGGFRTDGGQYRAPEWGLREWQGKRGNQISA